MLSTAGIHPHTNFNLYHYEYDPLSRELMKSVHKHYDRWATFKPLVVRVIGLAWGQV